MDRGIKYTISTVQVRIRQPWFTQLLNRLMKYVPEAITVIISVIIQSGFVIYTMRLPCCSNLYWIIFESLSTSTYYYGVGLQNDKYRKGRVLYEYFPASKFPVRRNMSSVYRGMRGGKDSHHNTYIIHKFTSSSLGYTDIYALPTVLDCTAI